MYLNVPELIKGEVKLSAREMRDVVLKGTKDATFDPNVDIDALSGATMILKK